MENLIKRLLEYCDVNVIGGEEAKVVRDVEKKDYIVTVPNKFGINIGIKLVDKIRYTEVSIYAVKVTKDEISFRVSDSNALMSSYIWVKEATTSGSQNNGEIVKEVQQLREENIELAKKYNKLAGMIENKFKSIENTISDMKNRNHNNNQKRHESNIPRVDIKSKEEA